MIPISIRPALINDVMRCVRMMWEDVLSKELPQDQTAEEFADDVFCSTRSPRLYEIKEGSKLLAFALVLIKGENYHL